MQIVYCTPQARHVLDLQQQELKRRLRTLQSLSDEFATTEKRLTNLDCLLEGGVVLHQDKVAALLVDTLNTARHDLVHETGKRNTGVRFP